MTSPCERIRCGQAISKKTLRMRGGKESRWSKKNLIKTTIKGRRTVAERLEKNLTTGPKGRGLLQKRGVCKGGFLGNGSPVPKSVSGEGGNYPMGILTKEKGGY